MKVKNDVAAVLETEDAEAAQVEVSAEELYADKDFAMEQRVRMLSHHRLLKNCRSWMN